MSSPAVVNKADEVGSQTLQRIERMDRFNQWMSEVIAPYVTGEVLEIGCGIGNISRFLLAAGHPVVGLDLSSDYIQYATERLGQRGFEGYVADITGVLPPSVSGRQFDTVVMLNVLEHIENEELALRRIAGLCRPGGRLVCLVPAHPWLFGTLDVHLGHCRRYHRRMLTESVGRAGFQTERSFFFNAAGMLGWWLNGRVLRARELDGGQLDLYDRLVPLFRAWESVLGGRVGQSLITVARKESYVTEETADAGHSARNRLRGSGYGSVPGAPGPSRHRDGHRRDQDPPAPVRSDADL
jgi:SAM-dependent methyltransferase